MPRAKTSSRPDAHEQTSGEELRTPPSDSHVRHCEPPGAETDGGGQYVYPTWKKHQIVPLPPILCE